MSKFAKKLTGKGLQYFVYEKGRVRVLKIPTTRTQKISILKEWDMLGAIAQRKALAAEKTARRSIAGIKKIIGKIDSAIIGNPVFLRSVSYEQDRVMTLGDYVAAHDLKENKKIINIYADSVVGIWRYGFCDTVFNFTVNNGVSGGRIILIDLGELSFSKSRIKKLVERKCWLNHWSYRTLVDEQLKNHYKRTMEKIVTVKALDNNWRAAFGDSGRRADMSRMPLGLKSAQKSAKVARAHKG